MFLNAEKYSEIWKKKSRIFKKEQTKTRRSEIRYYKKKYPSEIFSPIDSLHYNAALGKISKWS